MDEKIRLIIEAQNRTNPMFQAVTRNLGTVGTGMRTMGGAAQAAATSITGAMGRVVTAAHSAGQAFMRLGQTARQGLEMIGGPLRAISTGLAGLGVAGGAALTAFGALGIKSNQFKENTLAALTGMTKNRAVAEDLYRFLSKFADTTPFDDEEIVSAGKSLLTFGFNAKQMMTLVGDAAFTMKVPIEQVVNALAKLKAGSFDMAEMAPVGLTREGLESMGQKFSAGGEPENRGALLGQGIAILQQKFGGAMASGASGFDAAFSTLESNFRRLAAFATGGLFESLKKGFDLVSGSLVRFMETGGAAGGLAVIFDGVGRAVELAANQGLAFVGWLDAVVSREGVAFLLANIAGTLLTIGQSILKTFGVDLQAAMNPANVQAFFAAMHEGANHAITAFFGIGRVAAEVVRMMRSGFEDASDAIGDAIEDTTRGLKLLFLDLQISISDATATMMDSIGQVLQALASIQIGWAKPFGHLGAVGSGMRDNARFMREGPALQMRQEKDDIEEGFLQTAENRRQRAGLRMIEDPFRKQDPFTRLGDAFTGKNRPEGAEGAFRKLLEQNITGIFKGIYSPAGAGAAAAGFPAAPMLYGGGGGGSSVTTMRGGPAIPSLPDSVPYWRDGMLRSNGMSMGAPPDAGGGNLLDQINPASDDWTAEYIRQRDAGLSPMAGGRGGGGGGLNATINVVRGMTWEEFREAWLRMGDEAYRSANPGWAGN